MTSLLPVLLGISIMLEVTSAIFSGFSCGEDANNFVIVVSSIVLGLTIGIIPISVITDYVFSDTVNRSYTYKADNVYVKGNNVVVLAKGKQVDSWDLDDVIVQSRKPTYVKVTYKETEYTSALYTWANGNSKHVDNSHKTSHLYINQSELKQQLSKNKVDKLAKN